MPHLLHPYKLVMGGDIAPVVQSNFALSANDFDSLSSTSTMPTGGSISRAGNAMLYVVDGGVAKLTYAPNNLILQSNDMTAANWTGYSSALVTTANSATAPDGTTTANTITLSANTRVQNFSVASGLAYIASVWLRTDSGTKNITIGDINESGANTTATVTTTWQRFSIKITKTNSVAYIGISQTTGTSPSTSGTVYAWGWQFEAVTYQTSPSGTYYLNYPTPNTTSAYYGPRFDYDPVTLAAKGLLVEGTRTNLVTNSSNYSTSWSLLTTTATANSTTAPDGTGTAFKLSEQAANTQFGAYQSLIPSTTSTYTFSVYAKAAERSWLYLRVDTDTPAYITYFNLSNGTLGTVASGVTASITPVGNGWYRCTYTRVVTNVFNYVVVGIANANNAQFYPGTAGSGIFVWGAQLENNSFPSSLIQTVASSVTRAAETFSLTGYANRLVEAYYIDEQTGANYSGNSALSTGTVTISPPTFGWVTSIRAYTNAYAGSISSPSWLSFSRAGNATYYDSTGTLTWAPSNMLLNSATLSTQTVTVTSGATNLLSFSGTGSITYSGAASGTLTGTGANNRVSVVLTMSTTSLTLTVSGTVTNAQLERVTYATQPSAYIPTTSAAVYGPRYDYDPSTVPATPRGLLIEEQRANLCFYSNQFSSWFAFGTANTTPNSGIAPDGTNTAWLQAAVGNNGIQLVSMPASASTTYTFTIYAKAQAAKYIRLSYAFFGGAGANGVIDVAINTGVYVGNGWYRVPYTFTSGVGDTSLVVRVQTSIDPASPNPGYLIFGAQVEAGAFATSYIPNSLTTGSVTRAADVAQLTGSALTTAQANKGSVIAQTTRLQDSVNQHQVVSSVLTSYRYLIYTGGYNNQLGIYNGTSGVFETIGGSGTWTSGSVRAATGWDTVGTSIVANNGTVKNTAAYLMGATSDIIYVGSRDAGGQVLGGWVASLALYNTRLPDAILKQKSQVNAPY